MLCMLLLLQRLVGMYHHAWGILYPERKLQNVRIEHFLGIYRCARHKLSSRGTADKKTFSRMHRFPIPAPI